MIYYVNTININNLIHDVEKPRKQFRITLSSTTANFVLTLNLPTNTSFDILIYLKNKNENN